jgi:DNA polymerase type B, organellar and viral
MGAAIRWRHGLKRSDQMESATFDSARALWEWVSSYCKAGERTVAIAHNLGYDVRIASVFEILPTLGFRLEWCNLDQNVSAMTWRSDHGTLVLADSWTWLPVALANIGADIGLAKLSMPSNRASRASWERYCMRDAEILYHVVKQLVTYVADNDLGNWQPTGAGMAYAMWRHKFMAHQVLVHDDMEAIEAERSAMHAGRAEAWRHGRLEPSIWTEVDMKNAYVRIAAESELPAKLKFRTGRISNAQYHKLNNNYRLLCRVDCRTDIPCVPYNTGTKTLWPTGRFTTWLWDTEISLLFEAQQEVTITEAYIYTRAPVLQDWARWVLSVIDKDNDDVPPVVKTWAKHCGRALIGRIALRCPTWEVYGANPELQTGISHLTDADTGKTHRMMHVGNQTLIETDRREGKDSIPQVTGWIMAECRVRLWRAMQAAGLDTIAHVDTDSLLVSSAGLSALRDALMASFGEAWAVKGSWRKIIVYGPRNYRCGELRKSAGVPRKAEEILPNVFRGERWHGTASDLEAGRHNKVTVEAGSWELTKSDPRRRDSPGVTTRTMAYEVGQAAGSVASSSSNAG